MLEQLTIKNLYNHMDETIAKDIFCLLYTSDAADD